MWKAMTLSVAVLLSAPFASSDIETPNGPAELVATTAVDLSASSGASVADIVLRHVDERAIARFTLGRHVQQLNQDDISAYEQAFESYLRRQVSRHAHQLAGVRIDIERTDQRSPRDAIVTTRIYQDDLGQQALRWRVIERGGRWSVVDLEFAGVWLAIEQRAQINALLDRPGATIDDVIANLG